MDDDRYMRMMVFTSSEKPMPDPTHTGFLEQCPATVKIPDDHWGVFTDQCELPPGHQGDHRAMRTACTPVAYLGWVDEQADSTAWAKECEEFGCHETD